MVFNVHAEAFNLIAMIMMIGRYSVFAHPSINNMIFGKSQVEPCLLCNAILVSSS